MDRFESLHLTKIEVCYWPDTDSEKGRELRSGNGVELTFLHEYLGDHTENWVQESKDGVLIALHNPRYVETIKFVG